MRNPKLLAFPMIVMLGLLSTGLVYAHWSKTLYVYGHVNTGELDVEYLSASSDDPPGTIDVNKDKDVGSTTVELIDTDGDGDDDKIHVTITNAYPCYEVFVHFTVHNNGILAARFNGFGPQPPFAYDPSDGRWKATLFDGKITVHGWDGMGEQLDLGWTKDYTIWIHVEQEAEEDTPYEFEIEVWFDQWNNG